MQILVKQICPSRILSWGKEAWLNFHICTQHIINSTNAPYLEKSAKSVNFNPVQDHFDLSKLPSDKKAGIIFYCNAGAWWKGYKAAVAAVNDGYKKVYWFRGGLPEWVEKNYPTE